MKNRSRTMGLGGALTIYVRDRGASKSPAFHEEQVLREIGERMGLREVKGNDHFLNGGVIFRFLPPERRGNYVAITLGFREARDVSFIERLLDIATLESPTCAFRISVKDKVNFDELRRMAIARHKRSYNETPDGTFAFSIKFSGNEVRVSAYPSACVLSIEGTYNRFTMRVRQIINYILGSCQGSENIMID